MTNAEPDPTTGGGTVCPGDVHRAIVQALARHAVAQTGHLDVCAFGGEVTLVGDVCSGEEEQILIEAARQVPGVSRVRSRILVHEPSGSHAPAPTRPPPAKA